MGEAELTAIRREATGADAIVFLGFAFAEQNMELLAPEDESYAERVYATAKGISAADTAVVTTTIKGMLSGKGIPRGMGSDEVTIAVRNDLTCEGLFQEYRFSMAR